MSEKVIADFVARFNFGTAADSEPAQGRVILSQKRLVLATSDSKTTIPLATVFDINVGHVPGGLEAFFQDTVTIGYEREDTRQLVVVEAGSEEVERFRNLLFKAILTGTDAKVNHRARVGGRVMSHEFESANLRIKPGLVEFYDLSDPFEIQLSHVTYFQKQQRDVGTVVSVRHTDDGQPVTSEFALPTERKLNVLGRYLRLEYSDLAEEVEDIAVSEDEMEALVAVYSGASSAELPGTLGTDASSTTMLLNDLQKKGLVDEGTGGLSLTGKGQLIVSDRIETVNT